ncbi:hypothetical protein [Streptomyces sp. NPDC005989]|uniref:hypothetical protein n=1 Tax=Streptomyces sp. NPDC005989 TaxID=3156727 RepID=UPI0033F9CD55
MEALPVWPLMKSSSLTQVVEPQGLCTWSMSPSWAMMVIAWVLSSPETSTGNGRPCATDFSTSVRTALRSAALAA